MLPAGSVNIEMTGNGNKVTAFLNLVEPYGIIEMVSYGNLHSSADNKFYFYITMERLQFIVINFH